MTARRDRDSGRDPDSGRDRIVLAGMEFFGVHGVYDEEERLGARFVVDVECELTLTGDDSIRRTVDYGRVYRLVERAVTGPRFKLIEALAHAIALEVLGTEPLVDVVRVTVHKPHAPLPGVFRDVYVQVVRGRAATSTPRPGGER